jgi:predicted dehydrogenase
VICSPTKFHISQALLAAQTGTHLFIEKPLSYNMDGTEELEQEVAAKKIICMVGCNMRFHHGPAMVKNLMEEGRIGTVKHAEIYTGSFLPNWRPQQDYRKSYSADPLQGGAVLDCIHEIDLALWYLGSAVLEHAVVKPATSIGLAVDGTADITLKHKSGAMSQVHLSFTEPEYKRFCIVTGTNGVIKWDIRDNCVLLFSQKGEVSASYPEPRGYEFNWAYQEEISHFFRAIVQKTKPYGSLAEAKNALHIALQSRQCL